MSAHSDKLRARAHIRLLRDLRVLREDPLPDVAAEPLEEDLFKWHANFKLQGEYLHFEIFVPDNYPAEAPAVFFPTGLPHPNCFPQRTPDGRASYAMCLDMLGNVGPTDELGSGWSSAYDIRGILAQLQAFVLDHRNQYHRAGGLSVQQSFLAAHRYCCPSCPHRPGRPFPSSKIAEPRKKPALLRSLAPPCRTQSKRLPIHAPLLSIQAPPPEPKPWRDVQRLATHVRSLAAPLMLQCSHCPGGSEGFQKPRKGRTIRCERAAEHSREMHRYVSALKIQRLVRARLARALVSCLRRLQKNGAMPAALRAARLECIKIDAMASSLGSNLAKAQEAEAAAKVAAKNSATIEQRALAVARESLSKQRRNLQKKLRKICDTACKTTELSEEEINKMKRKTEVEKELRMLDRPAPLPSALLRFNLTPEEKKDAETASFYELFTEALAAERVASKRVKGKLREERRRAQWSAAPTLGMASQWATHIETALKTFIEMRQMGQTAVLRRALHDVLHCWLHAGRLRCCRTCGMEVLKSKLKLHEECCGISSCKGGACHIKRVPYSLQVGVILPMLTYQELLSVANVCPRLQAYAEEGCLWSLQMSRHYPLSALSAKSMKDWKYAFQCEMNQAVASLECFHTKTSLFDDASMVLGIPIEFTINPKTEKTDYIYSTMDLISYDAFAVDGVRKSVYKEEFTNWMPLYFSEQHWARALPHLQKVMVKLLPHRRSQFQPDMVIEVFSKMINTLVVLICDKGLAFSDRAAKAYCLLHRLALRCLEQWPDLKHHIDKRIDTFCRDQKHRSKEAEPNLGEFMACLLLSSRPWSKVAPHALEEMMDREVLWLCTECSALANLAGRAAPTDKERIDQSWKARLVGKRLYAFHVSCFTIFKDSRAAHDVAKDYDRFYGQPSQQILNQFRKNTNAVLNMTSWDTFFQLLQVKVPSHDRLAEMLRNSVKNSRRRGYHKDGMDFNRVHASGTSKILRKGESYLAAATLKAVSLEDHWSWAGEGTKFLDATCLVYNEQHKHVGLLDYTHKVITSIDGQKIQENVLTHSGDQIDHEKSSGFHQIHIQLDALPSTVQYLYITVSAWSDAKLCDIHQPSVRLLESSGEELCRYDVEGADGAQTAIVMCVLHRRPERSTSQVSRWALEAIGDVGLGAADRYEPIFDMVEAFRKRKGW